MIPVHNLNSDQGMIACGSRNQSFVINQRHTLSGVVESASPIFAMRLKTLGLPIAVVSLAFITLGDRFLPSPLNHYSWQTRTNINQFLEGALPQFKPKNPNAGMKKAVEKLEQDDR